jgi:hypothetical protein
LHLVGYFYWDIYVPLLTKGLKYIISGKNRKITNVLDPPVQISDIVWQSSLITNNLLAKKKFKTVWVAFRTRPLFLNYSNWKVDCKVALSISFIAAVKLEIQEPY